MNDKFDIKMISAKPNKSIEYIEYLKNADKPIIIFAASGAGKGFYRMFVKQGINITCFGDNSINKIGSKLIIDEHALDILSFQDILNNYPDAYIVICSRPYRAEIAKQFIQAGYDTRNIFAFDYNRSNVDIIEHINKYLNLYKEVYSIFNEDHSRNVFINRLSFLNTYDSEFIVRMKSNNAMYFDNDIMMLKDNEIIIDGGGYNGDTFKEYVKLSDNYLKYYFCEPDPVNMNNAMKNLSEYENIFFIQKGLWCKSDILTFSSNADGRSRLSENGNMKLKVTSIDELLDGKSVTLIKMDIEGAEMEALKGAKYTIQKYKPKLAICVYHKSEDIFEIPLYIKELLPDYKLYLRHYSIGMNDTVWYAI